jgi:phospholipid/cholesterol/gamma-HCH transport system substrate-binding protein
MGKKANPAIIGAFVVGAVVLAVVGVALFGSGRMFRTVYPYVLYFTGDVNGLKVGAPVKFKGVEIGSVKDVLLNVSEMGIFDNSAPQVESGKVRIPVIIELDGDVLAQKGSRIRPDSETIKRLIGVGLRGQLNMESFVTGLLYVKLDLFPGSDLNLVADPTVKYAEIPTLPTPLEEVQSRAAAFFAKLKDANIEGLVKNLGSAVDGMDRLVNSPKLKETLDTLPQIARNLDGAITRLETTLTSVGELSDDFSAKIGPLTKSVETTAKAAGEALRAATSTMQHTNTVLQPDSPIMFRLASSLQDLSEAARAIRRLAEDLERNPSILLRGKVMPKETP